MALPSRRSITALSLLARLVEKLQCATPAGAPTAAVAAAAAAAAPADPREGAANILNSMPPLSVSSTSVAYAVPPPATLGDLDQRRSDYAERAMQELRDRAASMEEIIAKRYKRPGDAVPIATSSVAATSVSFASPSRLVTTSYAESGQGALSPSDTVFSADATSPSDTVYTLSLIHI